MEDSDSLYNQLSLRSGYFKPESSQGLRQKKLKQPWRNHLLGIRLMEIGQLDEFHSVHIYPAGNKYQDEVCDKYIDCLTDEFRNSFIPVTFERFTSVGDMIFSDQEYRDWIGYLKSRY